LAGNDLFAGPHHYLCRDGRIKISGRASRPLLTCEQARDPVDELLLLAFPALRAAIRQAPRAGRAEPRIRSG